METSPIARSFGIGLTCGLRSMTGPAVVRWAERDPLRLAFAALALGELVADKLPGTPPRTIPPALAFRVLSGALCGRAVARAFGGDRAAGAVAGAVGAITATFLGMAVRARIVRVTRLPDPVVALAEDAVAIGGAVAAVRK